MTSARYVQDWYELVSKGLGEKLLRLHFTVEDLARLRMTATLGPVAESVFALDLFSRKGNVVFNGWRKSVRSRLGIWGQRVEALTRANRPVPDLLWLLEQSGGASGNGMRNDEQERMQVSAALFEFCQVAVVPYWSRARSYLEAERDAWGRVVITHGSERLLSTLNPKLVWKPPVLEIPSKRDHDVCLDGRGMLLSPSLFLFDKPCVVLNAERETGLPALAFSVPFSRGAAEAFWSASESNGQALAALVGQTRAAALEALNDGCTTSELARRLGISPAGASQHATVLRDAGLITTFRDRNAVLHTLTTLGVALLRSSVSARMLSTRLREDVTSAPGTQR
jgi:DNA-binding transcriptional ArsR family regulator